MFELPVPPVSPPAPAPRLPPLSFGEPAQPPGGGVLTPPSSPTRQGAPSLCELPSETETHYAENVNGDMMVHGGGWEPVVSQGDRGGGPSEEGTFELRPKGAEGANGRIPGHEKGECKGPVVRTSSRL